MFFVYIPLTDLLVGLVYIPLPFEACRICWSNRLEVLAWERSFEQFLTLDWRVPDLVCIPS